MGEEVGGAAAPGSTAPAPDAAPADPARKGAVEVRLRELVVAATRIPADRLSLDADLSKLGASSVDLMELVIEVEEVFDLEVPDTDLSRFRTFGAAVEYVAVKAKRVP